jgi:hypothetical protein
MAVTATTTGVDKVGYISWGAAIAGALLASALSFVLLTFGWRWGCRWSRPGPVPLRPPNGLALAVFWVVAQQIGSFLAGGYIAGRLRSRWAKPVSTRSSSVMACTAVWCGPFLLAVSLVISTALAAFSTWMGSGESAFFAALNFAISLAVLTLLFAMLFRWFPDA